MRFGLGQSAGDQGGGAQQGIQGATGNSLRIYGKAMENGWKTEHLWQIVGYPYLLDSFSRTYMEDVWNRMEYLNIFIL